MTQLPLRRALASAGAALLVTALLVACGDVRVRPATTAELRADTTVETLDNGMIIVDGPADSMFETKHIWCAAAEVAAARGDESLNLLHGVISDDPGRKNGYRYNHSYRFFGAPDPQTPFPAGEQKSYGPGPSRVSEVLATCSPAT